MDDAAPPADDTARLISLGCRPPFCHDLTVLFNLCAGLKAPAMHHHDERQVVTGFGVTALYPCEVPPPDVAGAQQARRAAEGTWGEKLGESPPEVRR